MSAVEAPEARLFAPFDACRVLSSPAALDVLGRLADVARRPGDTGEVAQFIFGHPCPRTRLARHVPAGGIGSLETAGAVDCGQGQVVPRFALFAAGSVVAVMPRPTEAGDRVYLGWDSIWLLETVWRLAPGGSAAVDLATGTGYLAAALASRYDTMVATDVVPSTAATAAITLGLNARTTGHTAVCVADVADGLRPASFDLVTANPPWVPSGLTAPDDRRQVFADGGPTGFELPRRFIMEGSALLGPGGIGVFQCLDLSYRRGGQPLSAVCQTLTDQGFKVEVRPTQAATAWPHLTRNMQMCSPDVAAAQLVIVVVRRPRPPTRALSPNS